LRLILPVNLTFLQNVFFYNSIIDCEIANTSSSKKGVVTIFEMFEIKIINKNVYAALILALPIHIRINCITASCSDVSWGLSNIMVTDVVPKVNIRYMV
jgi:hypothetical protein